jgi:hypothetical protein
MPPWGRKNPKPQPTPPGSGYHIKRLEDQPAVTPAPPPLEPAPGDLLAASFPHPAQALSFAAAVKGGAVPRSVDARRAPGGTAWVLVLPRRPADAELVRALGGTACQPRGTDLVSPDGRRHAWAALRELPEATWVELAADVAPRPHGGEQQEALIVTTGALAKWIIDKYRAADLDLTVSTAVLRSILQPRLQDWPAVLIRAVGRGRTLPRALPGALSELPYTIVCRPGTSRLLVDHRMVLPLQDEELSRQVPEGQLWLLSGGLGAWQVTGRSSELAPPVRAARGLLPPPVPPPGRFPPDLTTEVTLVPDDHAQTVDALLLSDDDLITLRRLLSGHLAAERGYLVLGPGWHLYADPGGDVSAVPLGLPLHRIGPGALYQEVGYRVHPLLPGSARAALFDVTSRSLVILRPGQALRLALSHAVPVWSLWLAAPVTADAADAPLSASALHLLERADASDARIDLPDPSADLPSPENAALRSEGFLLEQQGKMADAARKYWEAGEPAVAARLYELAAEAESAEPGTP